MKDLSKNVNLLCPLCGNDQFKSLSGEFSEEDSDDNVLLRCSDCGSVYNKEELIEGNSEVLNNAVEEMADEIMAEIEREFRKAFRQ